MKKYLCTACNYIYDPFNPEEGTEPGTSFEILDEYWTCPHCGETKDAFMEIPLNIQTVPRYGTITDEEERHIPYYSRSGGKIRVRVGSEDDPHPSEEGHFLEYIGLFDEDGEIIDMVLHPSENAAEFDDGDLDEFQILASCNIHGVWK